MNNREPSWWHMLWIIPSVIIAETAAILRMMRGRKREGKNMILIIAVIFIGLYFLLENLFKSLR